MPADGRRRPRPGSGLVIRGARSTDIEALSRLEAERFTTDRLSRRSLAALVKSPSAQMLVATLDAAVVGYALLLTRRGSRSARLYSIAVAAEASGQGIGARLMEAVEEAALRHGAERMHLEVRADNSAAISFYERSGYRPIGERPGYYQDGATALLFARKLEGSAAPLRSRRAA